VVSSGRYSVSRGRDSTEGQPSEPRLLIAAGVDVGRPIRTGVINNPLSFRNKRRHILPAILDVLRAHPWVMHHEVSRPEDVRAATGSLLDGGCELIVVNGGDGTMQAVLTRLFGSGTGALPLLAALPGGTTNMVAADVGSMVSPIPALWRLLGSARDGCLRGSVVERPVMRAEIAPGTAVFSMFFGSGAIYHGIRFCRQYVATLGLRGEVGPGVALAVFLAKIVLGHGGRMFPPLHLSGRVDGRQLQSGDYIGVLVSTVSRQFLGLRPFWGRESAPLKYSAMRYSPQHLWRAAPAVMRGKPNRFVRPEYGYVSHNAQEIELQLDCGFTLDGELFTAAAGTPVVLRSGYTASFLRQQDA
jgi:diacylglycerol kinase (ATP)